jgi:hypothetical protein
MMATSPGNPGCSPPTRGYSAPDPAVMAAERFSP